MTALLEVRDLTRSFGALNAVAGLSFSVRAGELVGLIGPNGAGKSTLYNMIAGAIAPTSGQVVYQGRPVGMVSEADLIRKDPNVAIVMSSVMMIPW